MTEQSSPGLLEERGLSGQTRLRLGPVSGGGNSWQPPPPRPREPRAHLPSPPAFKTHFPACTCLPLGAPRRGRERRPRIPGEPVVPATASQKGSLDSSGGRRPSSRPLGPVVGQVMGQVVQPLRASASRKWTQDGLHSPRRSEPHRTQTQEPQSLRYRWT